MQNVKFLNSLKLRASWGKLGNQEIGNYAYLETLSSQGGYYFGDKKYVGMKRAKIANENIKWETTTITDFGFDASFWRGKINVVFDWYEKKYVKHSSAITDAEYLPGRLGFSLPECRKGA